MITIGELYDVCDENRDLEIVAVLNGKEINLSGSFYVESEITYYYNDESDTCTCNQIIHGIECEAEDDCWMGHGFRARNTYEDCEVSFCIEDLEENFEIEDIFKEDNKVKLICK